jgi:hypothetical protein
MRRTFLGLTAALALLLGACSHLQSGSTPVAEPPPAATAVAESQAQVAEDTGVNLVVAPALKGQVDEEQILTAFRRAVDQGEKDFGLRPERTVTIYIDPDSAIGLEDALGLSSKSAIHLRVGQTRRMESLMPLMMHEYTHVLQHQIGRLRPQWFIEGQADHQSMRVLDPARAEQSRRGLVRQLASDLRADKAPALATLRGNTSWDEYVDRSGAGRAYGWGRLAVTYIEDGWGFDAVARIMTDTTGPNTMGSFDEAIRRETGLGPQEFESGLRSWLLQQA